MEVSRHQDALLKPAFENDINAYQVLDISVHEVRLQSQAYVEHLEKKIPWNDKMYDCPTKSSSLSQILM